MNAIAIFFLVTLTAGIASAQVKQWTDENGVTHFETDQKTRTEEIGKTQATFADAMQKIKMMGIITEIEKNPHLDAYNAYVTRTFYGLPFDDKKNIADILWWYGRSLHANESMLMPLDLIDAYTNKKVGEMWNPGQLKIY